MQDSRLGNIFSLLTPFVYSRFNYTFNFLKFGLLVFLEFKYNNHFQQCLTSSRNKIHKKSFVDQIWTETGRN